MAFSPSPPSSACWFYLNNSYNNNNNNNSNSSHAEGPYTSTTLLERLQKNNDNNNVFTAFEEVFVWRQGYSSWMKLKQTELIHELRNKTSNSGSKNNGDIVNYSVAAMTYDPSSDNNDRNNESNGHNNRNGKNSDGNNNDIDKNNRYPSSDLSSKSQLDNKNNNQNQKETTTSNSNNTSVYITGLPGDTDANEVYEVFSKCGIIRAESNSVNSDSCGYKIKLYRDKESGMLKGDALITYLKRPSIELAIQILDGTPLRPGGSIPLTVKEATFNHNNNEHTNNSRSNTSNKKNKKRGGIVDNNNQNETRKKRNFVKNQQEKQQLGWDGFDDDYPKKDVTIVLKNMFDVRSILNDSINNSNDTALLSQAEIISNFMSELRSDVVSEIDNKLLHNAHNKYNRSDNSNSSNINSAVRKFRSYNKSAEGAVSIELKTPEYVQKCIDIFNGRMFDGRRIVAERWDGMTNYNTNKQAETSEEMEKRLDKFGTELEEEED